MKKTQEITLLQNLMDYLPYEFIVNDQEIINLVLQENSESSDSPNTDEENKS
ncbi:10960_t:CDS:2 [Paraglomus brasilianum]|uniref:10960_t:CDS:1 n=1 Tax=Paraglomus brasilianum TaxID=144538 RepID=A0A9N9BWU4_9GLOM|nr:10960_t:CDS:2 [Paraglomus brasilianum]